MKIPFLKFLRICEILMLINTVYIINVECFYKFIKFEYILSLALFFKMWFIYSWLNLKMDMSQI